MPSKIGRGQGEVFTINERRIVITGIGLESPLGKSLPQLQQSLDQGQSGTRRIQKWAEPGVNLKTAVGSPVAEFDPDTFERKQRRTMSRVGMLAVSATAQALRDSDLSESLIKSDRTGISFASSFGGTSVIEDYVKIFARSGSLTEGLSATTYLKIMPHTCAANIAMTFGARGRLIASGVACASSTQAIGFAYESIKWRLADRMIAGGAEELTATVAGIFDVLGVTSTRYNDQPQKTPRPFDQDRDGIVVGEGAGTIILETLEGANARGAKIYAEVIGFFTNNDAEHMTNPSPSGLAACMEGAINAADIKTSEVDYINAHAAGTVVGDAAELKAISQVFSERVPISTTKGHLGHLFGAAGVTELAACLISLQSDVIYPTLNLDHPTASDGLAFHVMGKPLQRKVSTIIKNSFAFGGVNTSLVIRRL